MFEREDALAFEPVEVLCEGAAEGAQVIAFYEQREERVEFVEGVERAQEVAGVPVGCDGEEVAERRGEKGGELLFGKQFYEGGRWLAMRWWIGGVHGWCVYRRARALSRRTHSGERTCTPS